MNQHFSKIIERYVRWTLLSAFSGILSGAAAAIFLILLEWATRTRDQHPAIIWALPLAGLVIGLAYHHLGHDISKGNNLILDEIHDPKKIVPLKMAPFVLFGTVVTHLFGGSAGREGTAVQMGASLSDQLTRFFRIEPEERIILLVAGAGAGFGAAIGAPWAGAIFGMEVIAVGRLRLFAGFECIVASLVGFKTVVLLGGRHAVYAPYLIRGFDLKSAALVALAGVIFGLSVAAFVRLTHFIEGGLKRVVSYAPLRPLFAGILIVLLYRIEGTYRFVGLGIQEIQAALLSERSFSVPALKALFTALTIGSGFKGGEFIPLVFIGTTLGSALAAILPVSGPLLSSVGFAAVFGAAANTPIACSIMAVEIFGYRIAPYALIGCFAAYYASGHHGIYSSQKILISKHHRLRAALLWLGEFPKRFGDRRDERRN